MSHYDYKKACELFFEDIPFYAIIMAAFMKGDRTNLAKLKIAFPDVFEELNERYHTTENEQAKIIERY